MWYIIGGIMFITIFVLVISINSKVNYIMKHLGIHKKYHNLEEESFDEKVERELGGGEGEHNK
ncbi:hypothetical protein [Alkalibacillus haloalkaliphilus]|uniref:Uncharacterized protein n=1 Tax=Alkalibacillus haloalkaliphilus TaxID=94136 RepID=A0A511WAC2_9BACI|nr:hypothetical protein [Alkalibacillus haloalkaliphilus]GEN46282.1 hypothetical protein AHA02nite_20580 [Alkalibacillus haloalkaliphilus]